MKETEAKKIWGEALWREAEKRDELKEVRSRAWKNFEATGFPGSQDESWRYTPTSFIASHAFQFPAVAKPDAQALQHLQKHLESFKSAARIIFIDGWLMPQLSDLKPIAEQIDFSSMRELALHRPNAISLDPQKTKQFSAMNMALFQDGVWLNVHAGAKVEVPLLIYFLQTSSESYQSTQLQHVISMGEDSSLKIVEWHDHLSGGEMFFNQQMSFNLASSARLEHYRLQGSGSRVWMRSASDIVLNQKSRYQRLDLEAGSQVSRNEIQVSLAGQEANCELRGIGLGSQNRHFDTQVVVDHAVPAALSDQVYRNLLSGKSRGVFGGRVRVHRDAQKTEAHQVHKTLLLSNEARADTKPQLEIDADDVQCSHGAAIGQLDQDSLFYLRSRGINLAHAEKMLATGFVEKILDLIEDEVLRAFFQSQLKNQLSELF